MTDSGYLKVRAGPFPSRDDAAAAAKRIQQRLKGKPFVTQAPVP